jgi:hypothetical protein
LSPNIVVILNFVQSGRQKIVHPNNWFAKKNLRNLSKEYHWSPENHSPKAAYSQCFDMAKKLENTLMSIHPGYLQDWRNLKINLNADKIPS